MKKSDKTLFEIGHIVLKNISGEYWMTNLSQLLRQLPLIYLCIPGTIESQSYSSALSDNKKFQHSNITSQLFNGIRYLNITTFYNSKLKDWMCCKSTKLSDILRQISLFAISHPHEVIFMEMDITTLARDLECLNLIINRLAPILFTKKTDNFWISQNSLNSICNTGKNVILIYKKYSKQNERIFQPCTKYIRTNSFEILNNLLSQAEPSICSTFKIPPFGIKIIWRSGHKYNWMKCQNNKIITQSHENLINYVTNSKTSIDNLNKIFVLCVEYECYIDLLYLCMQIMDKRFFQ
jgi:hypothetical protein